MCIPTGKICIFLRDSNVLNQEWQVLGTYTPPVLSADIWN